MKVNSYEGELHMQNINYLFIVATLKNAKNFCKVGFTRTTGIGLNSAS